MKHKCYSIDPETMVAHNRAIKNHIHVIEIGAVDELESRLSQTKVLLRLNISQKLENARDLENCEAELERANHLYEDYSSEVEELQHERKKLEVLAESYRAILTLLVAGYFEGDDVACAVVEKAAMQARAALEQVSTVEGDEK